MYSTRRDRSSAATSGALILVLLLCLPAVGLSGYLTVVSAQMKAQGLIGPLAGCPETELISCGEVLASPYSQWLGIPLALAGTINYLLLLTVVAGLLFNGAWQRRRGPWAAALALAATGTASGVWLMIVQAFLLHRYCLLCDIVHACGLVSLLALLASRPRNLPARLWVSAGGAGLAGMGALVLGQVLVHPQVAVTQVVVASPAAQATSAAPASRSSADSQPAVESPPAGTVAVSATQPANAFRIVDMTGRAIATLDLDQEIVLGDPNAGRTVLEYMDFGCSECKKEFGLMQEVWKKHPHWFRLVVLLYPSNRACNRYSNRERPHICEITEAALAVLQHDRPHYADIHALFFQLQGGALTGGMAWQLVKQICRLDDDALAAWQEDPAPKRKIQEHTEIVHALLEGQQVKRIIQLPGLFAHGRMINGTAESVAQLEKHLTLLIGPPQGAAEDVAAK